MPFLLLLYLAVHQLCCTAKPFQLLLQQQQQQPPERIEEEGASWGTEQSSHEGDMMLTLDQLELLFGRDEQSPNNVVDEASREEKDSNNNRRTAFKIPKRRDVSSCVNCLWPNKTLVYSLDSSVAGKPDLVSMIESAMSIISSQSCVKFLKRTLETNFVNITSLTGECFSSVGYLSIGGQILNLQHDNTSSGYCGDIGIATHELLHALGFFHEQSRPDRDSYVNILTQNIAYGKEANFLKILPDAIDYQGSEYDYGSIMHYGLYSFSSNSKPTLEISNLVAYSNQGSPMVGQRKSLSPQDILQLNRRYNCPSSTFVAGTLRILFDYAQKLPSILFGTFARIEAVDSDGGKITKDTSLKAGSNFTWNEEINFGIGKWQFFRIFINPFKINSAQVVTHVPFLSDDITSVRHCTALGCEQDSFVSFRYVVDSNSIGTTFPPFDQVTAPITAMGTSSSADTTTIASTSTPTTTTLASTTTTALYSITLTPTFTTTTTSVLTSSSSLKSSSLGNSAVLRLILRALDAKRLPNTDFPPDLTDAYLKATALTSNGTTVNLKTSIVPNNLNPKWKENLDFGLGAWISLTVTLFDDDSPASAAPQMLQGSASVVDLGLVSKRPNHKKKFKINFVGGATSNAAPASYRFQVMLK